MQKEWGKQQKGFTIVELLIVIIIIGILAALVIVAYTGIQNRANDAAVQSDLRNVGQKVMTFYATEGKYPLSTTELSGLNLKVSKDAYGHHYVVSGINNYNMAYCVDATNNDFVIVAASKSGNVYRFKDGSVKTGVGPLVTAGTTCPNNGVSYVSSTFLWFYSANNWQSWIGS